MMDSSFSFFREDNGENIATAVNICSVAMVTAGSPAEGHSPSC